MVNPGRPVTVTCKDGKYEIVPGLKISEFSRRYMMTTYNELIEERNCIPLHYIQS